MFVGDDEFALCKELLHAVTQKQLTNEGTVFSYRLSRARRVTENTFVIMEARFRAFCFHTEINLKLERTETVVLSCCVLHNFLRLSCNSYAEDARDESEEEQSDILTPLQCGHSGHAGEEGRAVRENFSRLSYFNL